MRTSRLAIFVALELTFAAAAFAGPALQVDASAARRPISDDIYGMNYADEALAAELHLPVRRWGGNSTTRYNYQVDVHSTGGDYYFENIPDGDGTEAGRSSNLFIDQDRRTGTRTLMTVPTIGWTPKRRLASHPYDCGFKVSKFGAQSSTDPYDTDCGSGVKPDGTTNITGNNPADTSTAITGSFVSGWVTYLKGRYGTGSAGGVPYYSLDNEPGLWNSTHRDVHPQAVTYDELRDRLFEYGAAVKAADPTAKTLGPAEWGYCNYFYSPKDPGGCSPGADRTNHGDLEIVAWYLQQARAYEIAQGTRILDYLDLHYYAASPNGSPEIALSPAGAADTQARRLRSTRSLWDPSYTDESWIPDLGLGPIRMLPRMRDWVANNYPGTKLAITEYNWGGLEDINGALAQADVLGIFGREGLDLATIWDPPASSQPGAYAFRMYRNYDGAGHRFGDTSVQATTADQSQLAVYAAQRGSDNALTLMVINKTGGALASTLTLAGFNPSANAAVYRYSAAALGSIQSLGNQAVSAGGFSTTYPPNSITLFVLPAAVSSGLDPAADNDHDGIPNGVEAGEGRDPLVKDNDIFGNARLFAMQQYRDFLGREGDASGITYWTGQMNAAAQTRGQMVETFFNSTEFQGTVSPVARLYFAYLLRIPDYDGLNFWVGQYRIGNSLETISNAFAGSPEFSNTYGALTNGQFVDRVYRNVLGRAPDQPGLGYWTSQINGGMTRGQMMVQFSESPEYRAGVDSKVFVTMIYMGMLRRAPDPGGFDFWVGQRNAGSGQALIAAFLGSPEYRNRFLP